MTTGIGELSTYGTMGVLNVGAGDTKLSFDKNNPSDRIRAARIVNDMLRRGYALMVEVTDKKTKEKHFVRAEAFDESTCEYIIADFDSLAAAKADVEEAKKNEPITTAAEANPPTRDQAGTAPKRRGRPPKQRVDASTTRGIAVARSAGG